MVARLPSPWLRRPAARARATVGIVGQDKVAWRCDSGNIQGTFKEHSRNIQGRFKEHSRNIEICTHQQSRGSRDTP
eukprot:6582537-Pyramimonas_sp.AAC.1